MDTSPPAALDRPRIEYYSDTSPAPTSFETEAGGTEAGMQSPKPHTRVSSMSVAQLWSMVVDFLLDPLNVAMLFMTLVALPPMILTVLLNTGSLDQVFKEEETRSTIENVCTQVVNSLFFLMCLIFHPIFCRQSIQLYRWKSADILALRQQYCKGGKRKPHERAHITLIVVYLHITCFLTYGLAIVYWVVPDGKVAGAATWLIWFFLVGSFVAPALAALHVALSPLSRTYPPDFEDTLVQEYVSKGGKVEIVVRDLSQEFLDTHELVNHPHWDGTVVPGCCNSPRIACLVCLFPWCVFGSNQAALGVGHQMVSTLTFLLIMFGPLIVFELAAHTFKQVWLKDSVVVLGVVLAFLGLGYGAIWRRKMQLVYKLPVSRACCGNATVTDGCFWLACCYCALCQETRTVAKYEVHNGNFYQKKDVAVGIHHLGPEGPMAAPQIVTT